MAVIGLVCALIFHPVTLTNDAKEIVGSLIAQLVALLIFTIHALFQQHVSMPNPIQPESPANPEKVN